MINTVAVFAATCSVLDSDEIYELFEDLSDCLRDSIISYAEADTPEPVRSALNNIGKKFHVQSLINY